MVLGSACSLDCHHTRAFVAISPRTQVVVAGPNQANLYFIHPDHLNTPRLVADSTGTTVWRWDQAEPFGVNTPDENPSTLGAFEFPLRFPGQYADKETNLAFNYFRDFDPSIGRYTQSDPIGLEGGPNTYSYVDGNSLSNVDAFGLMGFGGGGSATSPQKPSQSCNDPCSDPVTLDITSTPCRSGDQLCAQAMQAAGIQGPYFPSSTVYSRNCLITFGIGFKGSLYAAGTGAQKYGPGVVTKVAGQQAGAIAGRVAAFAGSPIGITVSAGSSIAAILDKCKCRTDTR
jgi:RHS repeat-associated protein